MARDTLIHREPLLTFLVEKGFKKGADIAAEIHELGLEGGFTESDNRQGLGLYLLRILEHLPEGHYLDGLLTHLPLVAPSHFTGVVADQNWLAYPSESYLPAPGTEDAMTLAPSGRKIPGVAFPMHLRRTGGWLVSSPRPALLILTFDPGSLPHLEEAREYWLDQALQRRPDMAVPLATPGAVHFGLTSPHQFFQPSARWRRMSVRSHVREILERAELDPYLETELAIYCWDDRTSPRSLREMQQLADLTLRRVIVRPRLYPSHIPEKIIPPAPPETRLLNQTQDYWRRFFVELVDSCASDGDSDIHLIPKDSGGYIVKRRRAGQLQCVGSIPSASAQAYLAASLAGSHLELGIERSVPKDARMSITLPRLGRTIDLRINVTPGKPPYTTPGVVFRLLDSSTIQGGLDQILVSEEDRDAWNYALGCKKGLILVTGPTGTGKSRTLYAFLQSLHTRFPDRGYKSAEDPIELSVGDWLQQNQVNHSAGASFAVMLRALLRADPEVIFIGEIRDAETALVAITAARSGHLVVASLHTNTPADVPGRLKDLGVHPSDVKSLLRFASSQELYGRSCPSCRRTIAAPLRVRELLGEDAPATVRSNTGCPACFDLGIRGRFAVQEYLICPEDDEQMMTALGDADPLRIRALQRARGFRSLEQRALQFACGDAALTNIEEVS